MSDKVFVDTNIWVYFYSVTELEKKKLAKDIILADQEIVVSTQVLNEFSNVMIKKFKLESTVIQDMIKDIQDVASVHIVDISTINRSLELTQKYKYSYYDSLMIGSALLQNCKILFSEDMQNNHVIEESLRIKNVFI